MSHGESRVVSRRGDVTAVTFPELSRRADGQSLAEAAGEQAKSPKHGFESESFAKWWRSDKQRRTVCISHCVCVVNCMNPQAVAFVFGLFTFNLSVRSQRNISLPLAGLANISIMLQLTHLVTLE